MELTLLIVAFFVVSVGFSQFAETMTLTILIVALLDISIGISIFARAMSLVFKVASLTDKYIFICKYSSTLTYDKLIDENGSRNVTWCFGLSPDIARSSTNKSFFVDQESIIDSYIFRKQSIFF